MELCEMAESGGLSWEAQEVFQKIKSFGRLPGSGVPMIQLSMRVGSARTVKKGIPELKSAGLITDTTSISPFPFRGSTEPCCGLPPFQNPCVLSIVASLYNSLSTAAPPMGNADEPIFFKCAHIEFVRGDSFDRTAVGAKPRSFIFLRWGAANGVA
jgi:hypothetical protein